MIRYLLLALIPVTWLLEYRHAPGVWVFLVSAAAFVPLAGFMGQSTEQLAVRLGSTLGGLLSSTFGNAAENSAAVTFALRNTMNLAMQIPIGSSLQIALLAAPRYGASVNIVRSARPPSGSASGSHSRCRP